MITAPEVGAAVVISEHVDPELRGEIASIVGYEGHDRWKVGVKVRDTPHPSHVTATVIHTWGSIGTGKIWKVQDPRMAVVAERSV